MKSFFIVIFRRNIYLLLTAFGLFLTGYFLNLYFSGDTSVAGLRNSIQSFLQEREKDFEQVTRDTALMTRLSKTRYSKKELDKIVEKKYGIFLYGAVCFCNSGTISVRSRRRPFSMVRILPGSFSLATGNTTTSREPWPALTGGRSWRLR